MASCAKNGPDVNCCSLLPPSLLHTPLRFVCPSSQGRKSCSWGQTLPAVGRGWPRVTASITQLSSQSHPTSAGLLGPCPPNRSDPSPRSLQVGPPGTLPLELVTDCREASTVSSWDTFISVLCPCLTIPSWHNHPHGPGDPAIDTCGLPFSLLQPCLPWARDCG